MRTDNIKLIKNFGTGDKMIRYKYIIEDLFMDTFFATKNLENNYEVTHAVNCSLLIRFCLYCDDEVEGGGVVLNAVKKSKEIDAPEAIIFDAAGE